MFICIHDPAFLVPLPCPICHPSKFSPPDPGDVLWKPAGMSAHKQEHPGFFPVKFSGHVSFKLEDFPIKPGWQIHEEIEDLQDGLDQDHWDPEGAVNRLKQSMGEMDA